MGIASFRVQTHNEIHILKEDKTGQRYFPGVFYASGEMIRSCETQKLPQGVTLYLVPIDKLEVLEREN